MLKELKSELDKITASGRLRELHRAERKIPGVVEIRGRTVVDFSSADFLGVSTHKKVRRSAQEEVEQAGVSTGSPRLLTGTSRAHLSFERRLAQFMGLEAALLFSSRNQLVWSFVTSLAAEHDFLMVSEPSISPAADAAYLVNCPVGYFDPATLQGLEAELERHKLARRKFIFVESVSPALGKHANLLELTQIAAKYNGVLVIDDSYSLGLSGVRGAGFERGAGASVAGLGGIHASLHGVTEVRFIDLSVALAGFGAALVGPALLCSYILNTSRSFYSECSLPCPVVVACEAALDVVELMSAGRERLGMLAIRLRRGLNEIGLRQESNNDIPIVVMPFSRYQQARELADGLFSRGFLVDVASQRAMLQEHGIVRLFINIGHTERHIDDLLEATADLRTQLL